MSYVALYRKWRPDEFEEVKGQDHIVTTLKNQMINNRIGHAYLFCGTRGTGKTTIAKLLAKAVNCLNPKNGSPCNECESCKAIAKGIAMNVIEIDAASNNGVDNIRQINESVQYKPSQGKYLVYIIDEVHMLSMGAFNALLKTLEEPPSYVIFILATTEAHKIPITILSRCQKYDFRRISIETISDRLMSLLEREGLKATKQAVDYVAKAADGSMRDGLSILDQCISFNLGEELTYDKVLETIGAVDIEVYVRLLESIGEENIIHAINIIDEAVWSGKELTQFVLDFMNFIRNVLMVKLSGGNVVSMDLSTDKISVINEIGKNFTEQTLLRYINVLQEASNNIKVATMKRIILEVAIVKMFKPEMDKTAIEDRLKSAEKRLEQFERSEARIVYMDSNDKESGFGEKANFDTSEKDVDYKGLNASKQDASNIIIRQLEQHLKPAEYAELMSIIATWQDVLNAAMPTTRRFLNKAKLCMGEKPSSIDLVFENTKENQVAIEYFEKKENLEMVKSYLDKYTERDIALSLRKSNTKEANTRNVKQVDLSKINFPNIKYEN